MITESTEVFVAGDLDKNLGVTRCVILCAGFLAALLTPTLTLVLENDGERPSTPQRGSSQMNPGCPYPEGLY